jgi:NAD(P)-dependent dehydrogenase (short-subunit alcohol dehydrogenase family)
VEELSGRVAVVTGAASGIGLALCRRLGAEGMRIVMADVETGALEEQRAGLQADGIDAVAVRTDVTVADQVQALAEATLDHFGAVHVVCNNAGVFAGGLSWESPLSDYEWVLAVNTWGVIHGIRSFVPILLRQGEPGHVVNTASMAALASGPLTAAYFMSKHATLALSESLVLELQQQQAPIGVSVVCPELIATRIGEAERNRPDHWKRGDLPDSAERDLVESTIKSATASQGIPPSEIAERAVAAIYANQFYVLCPEDNPWRQICNQRLDNIRHARNPGELNPEDVGL